MIIDFHTHIFPDRLAAKTVQEVVQRSGIQAYADGTLKGLLASMAAAGIGLSVVCSVATRPEQVPSILSWLKTLQRPEIRALAPMHPDYAWDADLLKTLKNQGFPGFKLHPDYQDFFVDAPRLFPFYEACQELGLLILFHAGLDRGLPHPVHATPRGLLRVHEAFPRLRIVAAHMGGEDVYDETETCLLGRDIYLDTSFVLRKMPRATLERFFARHPPERILFASDSPWTDQGEELRFLARLPFLSPAALEQITGRNAAELLRRP